MLNNKADICLLQKTKYISIRVLKAQQHSILFEIMFMKFSLVDENAGAFEWA